MGTPYLLQVTCGLFDKNIIMVHFSTFNAYVPTNKSMLIHIYLHTDSECVRLLIEFSQIVKPYTVLGIALPLEHILYTYI